MAPTRLQWQAVLIGLGLLPISLGEMTGGRQGWGLIGYGIDMYKPTCAYACRSSAPTSPIHCPDDTMGDMPDMPGMDMGGMSGSESASPACLVQSVPFLQTVAWCLHTRCNDSDADVSTLENFWKLNMAGRDTVQPLPTLSYQQAFLSITEPPNATLGENETLEHAVLVPYESWLADFNADSLFELQEDHHETAGIILLTTGVAIPILFSLLRLLPFPASWVSTFYAYCVDPPLFGKYHAVPVLGLAIIPTRGQAFFVFYLVAINIILSSVGYSTNSPNSWYNSGSDQIVSYLTDNLGVLSFANLPLVFLYAGRNNFLLWLTNWSHSTFLLLHRWVAFICMLQAVLHSAIYLQVYTQAGYNYASESKLPYWYWGIIGTLSMSLLIPLSILPLRKKMYEVFLASHVFLSIMTVVGCWYHIIYRFQHQWGYETWLYIAIAIWAFDRLARLGRMARNGVKRAYVTRIDDEYLRIDVPGLVAHGHIYAYFPTLTWRVWENHPFSVVGVSSKINVSPETGIRAATSVEGKETVDTAIAETSSASSVSSDPAARGVTFFVRAQTGITSKLLSKALEHNGIPMLVESSYGSQLSVFGDHASGEYPNVLCIAGGVGITGVLPVLEHSESLFHKLGVRKLVWGVRSQPLVGAVSSLISRKGKGRWGNVDVQTYVAERMNVRGVLEDELPKMQGGVLVVVCGPPQMADEVRSTVAALARHGSTDGIVVKLVEESFSW